MSRALLAVAALAVFLSAAQAALACNCEEPVIVDAAEAYERALREDRDPVEGFWGIYMDRQPEAGANRSYRMAVVKNDYGIYEGADYIGVVTCGKPGCVRGEVKLLLTKTDDPRKFEATLLVTEDDGGKGTAILGRHERTGREDALLDLSGLRYEDKLLSYGMVRIING
jgi:hypothetical protein